MTKPPIDEKPGVSDHAMLRYLERVLDIDVDAMREALLTENVRNAMKMGASGVIVNGVHFVIKGQMLVTVMTRDNVKRSKFRMRRRGSDVNEFGEHNDG